MLKKVLVLMTLATMSSVQIQAAAQHHIATKTTLIATLLALSQITPIEASAELSPLREEALLADLEFELSCYEHCLDEYDHTVAERFLSASEVAKEFEAKFYGYHVNHCRLQALMPSTAYALRRSKKHIEEYPFKELNSPTEIERHRKAILDALGEERVAQTNTLVEKILTRRGKAARSKTISHAKRGDRGR